MYKYSYLLTYVCGKSASIPGCRYYAVCRPLEARYLHTVRRAVCLLVVFWVASLVLLLPQLYIQRLDPLLIVDIQPSPTSNSTASASIRVVHVCVEFFAVWHWNVVYTLVLYVALCILPVNCVDTSSRACMYNNCNIR